MSTGAFLSLGPVSVFSPSWRSQRHVLCDPADELHRNRLGEWEMDRSLSQVIAPELIFQHGKESSRRGKQRIVFLETCEIQHRPSVELVSGHTVPDALQCLRNGSPDRGAHLFELDRTVSGCAAMYSSTDFGTPFFIPSFYVSACAFFTDIRLAQNLQICAAGFRAVGHLENAVPVRGEHRFDDDSDRVLWRS